MFYYEVKVHISGHFEKMKTPLFLNGKIEFVL